MMGKTTRLLMFAGLGAVLVFGSAAQAKSVNGVIFDEIAGSPVPIVIDLEDNDATVVYDNDFDGLLSKGDVLRSQFEVQRIVGPAGGTTIGAGTVHSEGTAVVDVMVTGKAGGPAGPFTWTFGPDPAFGSYAGDPTVFGGVAQGVSGMFGGLATMTVYDDSAQDYLSDTAVAGSEEAILIPTAGDTSPGTAAALWAVFGMVRPTSSWTVGGPTDSIPAMTAGPAPGAGPPAASGFFDVDLIPSGGLADPIILPAGPIPGASGEMTGSLSIYGKTNADGSLAKVNWDVLSDTDLKLNVVPVPAAVWAGVPLFGLALVIRRRFLK
jgi:hypothetical protein